MTALPELDQHAAGLRLRQQDIPRFQSWIVERTLALGLADSSAYLAMLSDNSATARSERERIAATLTTGETYFWRDQGHFELIAKTLLPELIARRTASRTLRLWSAGCATGEEAYSLAMLLRELQDSDYPELAGWDIRILATDINSEALIKARKGLYGDWSFRALSGNRKARFFKHLDGRWQIDPALRESIEFRQLDLVNDRIPDASIGVDEVDLILCRNVFIYMTPAAISQVSHKLGAAVQDGGYLITGHGELLGHNTPGLHPQIHPQGVVLHKSMQVVSVPLDARAASWHVARGPAANAVPAMNFPGKDRRIASRTTGAEIPLRREADKPELTRRRLQDAWRLADQGEHKAAADACQRALVIDPLAPWPYYLQAQLAQERGDSDAARQLLVKVIYLEPGHVAAHLELATLQHQSGQAGRARQNLLRAQQLLAALPPDASIAPYEKAQSRDLLAYVEHLLDGQIQLAQQPQRAQQPHITRVASLDAVSGRGR